MSDGIDSFKNLLDDEYKLYFIQSFESKPWLLDGLDLSDVKRPSISWRIQNRIRIWIAWRFYSIAKAIHRDSIPEGWFD